MKGTVKDVEGRVLPGVPIAAVHLPTGTTYEAVSRANGAWEIMGMRAGGPYTATATLSGYNPETKDNLYLKLGIDTIVDFVLSPESAK